jgi:hypothetical protein
MLPGRRGVSMFKIGVFLRWIGALAAAIVILVTVMASGALIWQRLGTDVTSTVKWTMMLATALAVLGGTLVVPRDQWKAAALTLWLLASASTLYFVLRDLLIGDFSLANFQMFCNTMIGGFVAYYSVRTAFVGGKINRVSGKAQQ